MRAEQTVSESRKNKGAHWLNRLLRILLAPVIGLITFSVLTIVTLTLWVGLAPLNVTPFLPYFLPEFNRQLAEATGFEETVNIEEMVIEFRRETRVFEIEAKGIQIDRADEASIGLQRAFFKLPLDGFNNAPLSPIILTGLDADVLRDEAGDLTVNGFSVADLRRLSSVRRVANSAAPPPILITAIEANLNDLKSGLELPLRADRIDVISLASTTEIFGQLRVRNGDFVGSRIDGSLSMPREGQERFLALELAGFNLARLERSGLLDLEDLTLSGNATGSVTLVFDRNFGLVSSAGTVSLDKAGLTGEALPEDLDIVFAQGEFSFDPNAMEFAIDDLIATGDIWTAGLNLRGSFGQNADGEISSISTKAETLSATLNAPEYFTAPHQIRANSLDVNMQLSPWSVELQGADILVDDVAMQVNGSTSVEDNAFLHRYRATSAPRQVEQVLTFWPIDIVPNTRKWALGALHDATISNLDFAISALGPKTTLRMNFDFDGLNAKLIKGFPQVSNASGSAALTEKDFSVDVASGDVFLPKHGAGIHKVDVTGSTFYVPDINQKIPDGQANIFANGTLKAAEVALDLPPFEFLSKTDAQFPDASGLVDSRINLVLPLQKVITTQDVTVDAEFDVSNFRTFQIMAGKVITSDILSATTDGKTLAVEGPVALNGHPGNLTLKQSFAPDGVTFAQVDTTLTAELAAEFGVPSDQVVLEGASPLSVNAEIAKGGEVSFTAQSELKGLRGVRTCGRLAKAI